MMMYLHLMKAISKLANGIQLLFEFSLVKVCNHLRYVCNFELLKLETDWWESYKWIMRRSNRVLWIFSWLFCQRWKMKDCLGVELNWLQFLVQVDVLWVRGGGVQLAHRNHRLVFLCFQVFNQNRKIWLSKISLMVMSESKFYFAPNPWDSYRGEPAVLRSW